MVALWSSGTGKKILMPPLNKNSFCSNVDFSPRRLQHIIMFAMLKIDRVLASCLPFGKYPIFSVEVVSGIVLASWFVSFFIAGTVTAVFNSSYEPAVVLCIPELPVEFFITIFSIYCAALLAMVGGYVLVIWHLKKKRAQIR